MKKIVRPEPDRIDCDANKIQGYLDRYHLSESKRGNTKRTLYGCFKLIARLPAFSPLGDYPILAQCVEWMDKKGQKITEREISRSLCYFQDYDRKRIKVRKQMVDSLMNLRGDI